MESRRLFIGGLYNDVKEVDLRDRFKSFGTVSSIEIKRKTDEQGVPIKTFAYLDIKQTESDFKRCVSLLSNSKWKGCCLKVQAAKESFLARLERERQQRDQSNTSSLDKGTRKEPSEKNPEEETQAIPKTLPKAVPGTPLPGKKNWVVGKFGRVLPVVYLRRRDRKKIAKFDPSKTTHCLKRINLQDPTVSVSGLTWQLDSANDIYVASGKLKNMAMERKSKFKEIGSKQSDNGINISVFHESAVEKRKKKSSERMHANDDMTFEATKLSASDESDLESESTNHYSESHSYTKLNKISLNKAETDMADAPDRSASNVSHSQNIVTLSILRKKNNNSVDTAPQRNTNGFQSSSLKMRMGNKNSHHEPLLNNGENNADLSEEGSLKASKRQSSDSSDELSDSNSSRSEKEEGSLTASKRQSFDSSDEMSNSNSSKSESSSSENEDETSSVNSSESETVIKKIAGKGSSISEDKINNIDFGSQSLHIDSEEVSVQSLKAKGQSRATNDTQKKLSNDKRLDALEGKKKSALAQKNAIKDALKDLDSSVRNHDGKKHIIFGDDDDGNSDKVMEKAAYSLGEKISGSRASAWLGLESDSDEGYNQMGDGDDSENDQLVTVKPHFEGKAGEELFKLQRTFGGDKRFELDSRFLESEEEDDGDDMHTETGKADGKETLSKADDKEDVFTGKENDISGNLKHEKEMAMKVLSKILGGEFRAEFSGQESQEKVPEFRSSAAVHYDPDREDHKQFEQTTAEKKEKIRHEAASVQGQPLDDPVLPEVSKDKYYDANTSLLADLFGNKKQGGSSFTFLSHEPEEDTDLTVAENEPMGSAEEILKNPWQTTQLPYDSSDDNDDDDGDDGDDIDLGDAVGDSHPSSKFTSQLDELFFFHPGDPELENRINDKDALFMRTGTQEDVSEYWVSVRSELTQDYKRKRKDAVRRQNKLAAKRIRHK